MIERLRLFSLKVCRQVEAYLLRGGGWHPVADHGLIRCIKCVRVIDTFNDGVACMVVVQMEDGSHLSLCMLTELERL